MNNPFFSRLITLAGLLGAFGVMIGAFGAHFLKSRLDTSDLTTLKTGVLYLFIHVLAIILIGILGQIQPPTKWLKFAGISFILGILFFSGSLFIIATSDLTGFPVSMIGILTPLGGLFFITGWIALLVNGISKRPIR